MKGIALVFGWIAAAMIGISIYVARADIGWKAWAVESSAVSKATARKVDLNTATLRQLERLPGIGPELAKRVVQHRPYHKLDELITRKVLGRKQFARIKERIRVDSVRQGSAAR